MRCADGPAGRASACDLIATTAEKLLLLDPMAERAGTNTASFSGATADVYTLRRAQELLNACNSKNAPASLGAGVAQWLPCFCLDLAMTMCVPRFAVIFCA